MLKKAATNYNNATIFAYKVNDPKSFGIIEYDDAGKALSIEEKPDNPKSSFAATGLYFYPNDVVNIAKQVKPSNRGELEITSINSIFLEQNRLDVESLGRGFAWLDTGTHESLNEASSFVKTVENRQGLKIACLEEIAFNNKWLDAEQLEISSEKLKNTSYGEYLKPVSYTHLTLPTIYSV